MTPAQVASSIRERVETHAKLPPPAVREALRVAAAVSRKEIASAVGTTVQTIGRWEAGTRTPRGELLDRYVAALEVLRERP